MIQTILDSNASTKKIKKGLSMGNQIISYILHKNGEKQYSRPAINNIATKYYANLYCSNVPPIEIDKIDPIEPEILKSKIEGITKNLKNKKAAGSDCISNEIIKYGGNKLID